MPTKRSGPAATIPKNYEGIVNLITHEYPNLSTGFQQIARFLTQNPNVEALESINAVAAKCGTHPSSLVRLPHTLGSSVFKEAASVCHTRLPTAAPGFRERVSALESELSRNKDHGSLGYLRDLVVRDMAALQDLLEGISEETLADTAKLLVQAETIYIAGQLRSEPIASLLRYLLTMLRRRIVLLDPAGGLAQEMATTMTDRDVLIAIAFRHYAKEVVVISDVAVANGTSIVAITDSQLSPLAKDARILFAIPEDEYAFSRPIAAPRC